MGMMLLNLTVMMAPLVSASFCGVGQLNGEYGMFRFGPFGRNRRGNTQSDANTLGFRTQWLGGRNEEEPPLMMALDRISNIGLTGMRNRPNLTISTAASSRFQAAQVPIRFEGADDVIEFLENLQSHMKRQEAVNGRGLNEVQHLVQCALEQARRQKPVAEPSSDRRRLLQRLQG